MREIDVEVVFAMLEHQECVSLSVSDGTTLIEAIVLSGLQDKFPDIDFMPLKKGVWNAMKPDHHVLQAGDRVEIYRPLVMEPKEARRKRALKKQA